MRMPAVLSDLERNILDYMVRYLRTHTYQPSIREIGEEFGIRSTKTVSEHLGALAEKGYLERDPSRSRGIRILGVDLNPQTVSLPCYAAIPDPGQGFESDGVEAWYSLDRRLGAAKGAWFLRARDARWTALGVSAGDFLLVEPARASDLRDGDLAVIRTGESPDLYRVVRPVPAGPLRLRGAGTPPGAASVVEDATRLVVGGRVAGLHRRFDAAAVPVSAVAH
jgi:repressor LexA